MFTLDSLLAAVDFLSMNVVKTRLDIVSDIPSMRRYLWYILTIISACLVRILTYDVCRQTAIRLSCILALPPVTRLVCLHAHWFDNLYREVVNAHRRAVKTAVCSCTAFVANTLCREVLNHDCMVSRREIEAVYDMYDYSHVDLLVRIFIAVNIVGNVDATSRYFGGIVRMLYNRGKIVDLRENCGYVDPYPETKDPKEKIRKIVMGRKWDLFYNPIVMETLIAMYKTGESGKFLAWLRKNLMWVGVTVTQFFTVWTLSGYFRSPLVLLVVSCVLLHARCADVYELMFLMPFRMLGVVLAYGGWFTSGSAVSELSDLLWNRSTWWLGRKIQRRLGYCGGVLVHDNSLNVCIFMYAVLPTVFYRWLQPVSATALLTIMPLVDKPLIAIYMMFGLFSGFSTVHMLMLSALLYVSWNVYNYKTAPERSIRSRMIQSYYFEPRVTMNPTMTVFEDYMPMGEK